MKMLNWTTTADLARSVENVIIMIHVVRHPPLHPITFSVPYYHFPGYDSLAFTPPPLPSSFITNVFPACIKILHRMFQIPELLTSVLLWNLIDPFKMSVWDIFYWDDFLNFDLLHLSRRLFFDRVRILFGSLSVVYRSQRVCSSFQTLRCQIEDVGVVDWGIMGVQLSPSTLDCCQVAFLSDYYHGHPRKWFLLANEPCPYVLRYLPILLSLFLECCFPSCDRHSSNCCRCCQLDIVRTSAVLTMLIESGVVALTLECHNRSSLHLEDRTTDETTSTTRRRKSYPEVFVCVSQVLRLMFHVKASLCISCSIMWGRGLEGGAWPWHSFDWTMWPLKCRERFHGGRI